MPTLIVSGGQTGVDRGALDVAIDLGIPHGGWCPKGRLSEDGSIPSRYDLTEHESSAYPARTEQNVIDSDATLILYEGRLGGGSLLTKRLAGKHGKPHLTIKLRADSLNSVRRWLEEFKPAKLNVAGPRESTSPGIEARTAVFLHQAFSPDPSAGTQS